MNVPTLVLHKVLSSAVLTMIQALVPKRKFASYAQYFFFLTHVSPGASRGVTGIWFFVKLRVTWIAFKKKNVTGWIVDQCQNSSVRLLV